MTDDRPNILWYCTDQQRFDTIGALGNSHVVTPVVDQLVQEGVAFTHAYCQSPICTPSRSSFMTGMYPSRVHNTRNGNETFDTPVPLVSKMLADAGYHCGLVGKFHLQSSGHRTEPRLDDGYSYWKFSHAPRDDWQSGHDYADWVTAQGGDLDVLRASEDRVPSELHQTTWGSDRAIEFIESESPRPWMLSVNIYDPHPPFVPPRSYADRFDPADMPGPHFLPADLETQRMLEAVDFQGDPLPPADHDAHRCQALYYAMIAQIDDQFARVLKALDDTGQRDRTVIIFTSDHGEALGDHGLMQKGCRFYEGLVRVPLIFRWPGHFLSNLQRHSLVELLDLTATIIDLAGIEQPEHMQGRSLLPLLTLPDEPDQLRESVRCEYFDALDPHFTGGSGTYATMYRNQRYKLSIYHGLGLGELYDLEEDPWEHNNLWDDPASAAIRAELTAASFDNHVLLTTDVGSRRIAPM